MVITVETLAVCVCCIGYNGGISFSGWIGCICCHPLSFIYHWLSFNFQSNAGTACSETLTTSTDKKTASTTHVFFGQSSCGGHPSGWPTNEKKIFLISIFRCDAIFNFIKYNFHDFHGCYYKTEGMRRNKASFKLSTLF